MILIIQAPSPTEFGKFVDLQIEVSDDFTGGKFSNSSPANKRRVIPTESRKLTDDNIALIVGVGSAIYTTLT